MHPSEGCCQSKANKTNLFNDIQSGCVQYFCDNQIIERLLARCYCYCSYYIPFIVISICQREKKKKIISRWCLWWQFVTMPFHLKEFDVWYLIIRRQPQCMHATCHHNANQAIFFCCYCCCYLCSCYSQLRFLFMSLHIQMWSYSLENWRMNSTVDIYATRFQNFW